MIMICSILERIWNNHKIEKFVLNCDSNKIEETESSQQDIIDLFNKLE